MNANSGNNDSVTDNIYCFGNSENR